MTPVRLLRFVLMAAMLFASIGMIGGHAAMATSDAGRVAMASHDPGAPAGHCADRDQVPPEQHGAEIDCMMACSALPATSFMLSHPVFPHSAPPAPLACGHRGLHPESDPPPPRATDVSN